MRAGVGKCRSEYWLCRFLTVREGGRTCAEREKAGPNPVALDWNWKYQYEHIGFKCVCVGEWGGCSLRRLQAMTP